MLNMIRTTKLITFFASLAFVSLPLKAADPGLTDTEIKIGAFTSESGGGAGLGIYAQAVAAYFDDVNAAGGIHGRKLKWMKIDTQQLEAKTVQATRTLIEQDKVFAMVGSFGATHLAVWKYITDKKVPDIFPTDTLEQYVIPVEKHTFLPWYTVQAEGRAHAKYIAENLKGKKACAIAQNSPFHKMWVEAAFKALATENEKLSDADKIKIGVKIHVDKAVTQANSEFLSLQKEKCDVVMAIMYGTLLPTGFNYAYSQGFKPVWTFHSANVGTFTYSLLHKEGREGILATTPFGISADSGAHNFPEYQKFCEKHKLDCGNGYVMRGFAVAELSVEAFKRAGKDLTREKLLEATETISGWKCSLCADTVNLSKTNHVAIEKPFWVTVKDGKFVLKK